MPVHEPGQYRTGRHNRQKLIYFQHGPDAREDSTLRFVIVEGPIDGDTLVRALNTPEALAILKAAETEA